MFLYHIASFHYAYDNLLFLQLEGGAHMKLGELLNSKDFKYRVLVTARENQTVSEAIRSLVEHDRGSLPVRDDNGEIVGIITERDIVRKCVAHGKDCAKIKVRDVMSKQVVIGTTEDDLSYAINVMKQHRIRHLPIVENQKLIGIISMRDLLGVQLEECKIQTRLLSDYISGSYGQSET